MNYIKQINGFWNWVLLNGISQGEIILYMAILHCANISNWKSSLNIPNSTLQSLAKISNASQLNKIRNRLIQTGLIRYQKGKGNTSGIYTVVRLYSKSDNQSDNQLDNQMDNQSDNQTDAERTTYINKTETKQNKTVTVTPKPPNEENELSIPPEIVNAYEQNIGLVSPVILDSMADWLKSTDADVIIWAIGEAVQNNKCSWKYVEGILNNHVRAGRTTLEKIQAHNRTYRRETDGFKVYEPADYDYDEIERAMHEKYDNGS